MSHRVLFAMCFTAVAIVLVYASIGGAPLFNIESISFDFSS